MRVRERIREALLRGDIIKKDAGASIRMQIIPREQKGHMEVKFTQMTNIGVNKGGNSDIPGSEFIPYRNIGDIIEELTAEGYTVLSEDVHSGCCQYHTKIYYLAGE